MKQAWRCFVPSRTFGAMKILLLMFSVLVLTACESKEAKYARLSQDLAVAELMARPSEPGQPRCPDLVHLPTNTYSKQCSDRMREADAKLALARREMNTFMQGR
jgi:hypothetical protein